VILYIVIGLVALVIDFILGHLCGYGKGHYEGYRVGDEHGYKLGLQDGVRREAAAALEVHELANKIRKERAL